MIPFKEDEIFGEILKEIETEFSTIESQPTVRFSSGLETVLRDEIKTLSAELEEAQKIYSNESFPQSERTKAHEKILSKKPILGHYKNLVMLIKRQLFMKGFLKKKPFQIIDRSLGGKVNDISEDSAKFIINDLKEISDSDLENIVNNIVYNYLDTLNHNDGKGFEVAIELLNDKVDAAIKQAFRFNLKQKTFAELIEDIRRKLFKRSKGISSYRRLSLHVRIKK